MDGLELAAMVTALMAINTAILSVGADTGERWGWLIVNAFFCAMFIALMWGVLLT